MKKIIIKFVALLMLFSFSTLVASATDTASDVQSKKVETYQSKSMGQMIGDFLDSTGINALVNPNPNELDSHGKAMSDFHKSWGRVIMILITFVLFYLAIVKGFGPSLLLPIGFGGLLANIPVANMAGPVGFLAII